MRYARMLAIATVILLLAGGGATPARADVSFSFFYSNLEPHGSWHLSAQYGRVWQPAVYTPQWNPYHDGHWVYTDVGWTWVSDYGWGAVPYHYGTWVPDPNLGWVWVPGYTWAPSWVVFRTGPDYIGWAPVPPTFRVGVSFGFGDPSPNAFVFVSSRNFLAPSIRTCVVPQSRTRVIVNRTTVVNNVRVENNVVVNRGPDPREIERVSGRKVRAVRIEQVPRAAPGRRFDRNDLRVDPRREKEGLRAAEPASSRHSTPVAANDRRAPRETVKPKPPASEQGKGTAKRSEKKPAAKQKGKEQGKKGDDRKNGESKGESPGSSGDRPAHERSHGNRGVS